MLNFTYLWSSALRPSMLTTIFLVRELYVPATLGVVKYAMASHPAAVYNNSIIGNN